MSSTMDLICPAREDDVITHKTKHGIFTYVVVKASENMPINFQVNYKRKEEDLE